MVHPRPSECPSAESTGLSTLEHRHRREPYTAELPGSEERIHGRTHDHAPARERAFAMNRRAPMSRPEPLGRPREVRHAYDALADVRGHERLRRRVEPAVTPALRARRFLTRSPTQETP